MARLIRIGFFRELRHGDAAGPSLAQAIAAAATPDEARLVGYLRAGAVLIYAPGVVRDVLDPGAGIIGSATVLTDGSYAWPEDLAHYVARHHVRLPDAFVAHAAACGWRVPPDVDVASLEL